MRIVIDMLGAQTESRFRGIGRYSIALTKALVSSRASREVILVVHAQLPESIAHIRKTFDGILPQEQIRVFDTPATGQADCWANHAAEILREDFIARLNPDIVLLTSVVEGYWLKAVSSIGRYAPHLKTAAILYDLIPLIHPDDYLVDHGVRRSYLEKVEWLRKADLLLGISESSCQEGVEHLGRAENSVVNISAAVDGRFRKCPLSRPEAAAELETLGIFGKYVLYAPGGFDSRKNFARLIEAYSQLSDALRSTRQLVIASKLPEGGRASLSGFARQYGLAPHELVLPGYVEDDVLITLYSNSELFVFPSVHEGFGLPLLEAMSCGAPAIGSNCTSIPEVIGLDEALFDPLDVNAIRNKMAQALSDPAFAKRLSEHAGIQTKNFAWESSAKRAWEALDRLHGMPARAKDPEQGSSANPLHILAKALASIDGPAPKEETVLHASRCIVFNHGAKTPQLLLDVSELAKGDARSGIQRVVRSILLECLNAPPAGFEVRPIRFDGTRYWYANQLATAMHEGHTPTEDAPADFFQDDVYLCLDLLMHLGSSFWDVHQDLSVRGVSLNYIVYDLLPLQAPQWWPPHVHPHFLRWITELGRHADRMVCISNAVADELTMWLAQHPPERVLQGPRVASFHLGADVHNSLPSSGMPDNAQAFLDQLQSAVSFLMVSTIEPRKGHAQALSAFEQLWVQGHDVNLVIVGKRGWKVDELVERMSHHAENGRRLHWLEGVSDEFLEKIYAASDCLVLASLGEGFGLPLVEAAQHGLPILARDLPVLREVAGEHAFYFEGLQPEDLTLAITRWLHLKESGRQPGSSAIPRLTWKQSTQQLLHALGILSSATTPASAS